MSEDRFAQKALPQRNLDIQPSCMSDYVSPEDQIVWASAHSILGTPNELGLESPECGRKYRSRFVSSDAVLAIFPDTTPKSVTLQASLALAKERGEWGVVLYDARGKIVGVWRC